MDENHQDKTESKPKATEDDLWLPPLSLKDQKKLKRLRKKTFTERMGVAGKTPWDLVQLLIIPLTLLVIGSLFSYQQSQSSIQSSEKQHQTDLQIANDQQQETTLKTYLDDMSDLLLNHNLSHSQPGDEVREVARERTLTTLRRLNADRNKIVFQFLQDSHLIGVENTVVDLVDLSHANLSHDELRGVNLSNANLTEANLSGADLSGAELDRANLSSAKLNGANLSSAHLEEANLSSLAPFTHFPSVTDLSNADLSHADLSGAKLRYADLTGAYLVGAYLNCADLSGAVVTKEQLDKAGPHDCQDFTPTH